MLNKCARDVLAFSMLLAAAANTATAEEVVLNLATTQAQNVPFSVGVIDPWVKEINEEAKGVLRIELKYGIAIAGLSNIYERVQSDVVQIGFMIPSYVAGKFPLTDVTALPFASGLNSEQGSVAFYRMYKTGALDGEYDEIVPLMLVQTSQNGLHFASAPKSLDHFDGTKVTVYSKIQGDAVSQLGLTPSSIPLPEIYTALQRGTVQGVTVGWSTFEPFKLAEVTSYHVDVPLGAVMGMLFMSRAKFNSLPDPVKKILLSHSGEAQSRTFGAVWNKIVADGRASVAAMGKHEIVTLTPEQLANWKAKIAPVVEAWQKNTPGGAKTLEAFQKELANVQ